MNKRYQLWEAGRQLTATAQGIQPADLLIKNGRLLNVFTGEIQQNIDVAVKCGRIALVGDGRAALGEQTTLIDADGMVMVPGFIDGHLHMERSC